MGDLGDPKDDLKLPEDTDLNLGDADGDLLLSECDLKQHGDREMWLSVGEGDLWAMANDW